jgi:hypothetical protein
MRNELLDFAGPGVKVFDKDNWLLGQVLKVFKVYRFAKKALKTICIMPIIIMNWNICTQILYCLPRNYHGME